MLNFIAHYRSRVALPVLLFAGVLSGVGFGSVADAGVFVATNIPVSTSDFGYLNPSLTPLLAVDLNGSGETINGVTFAGGALTGGGGGITYSVSSAPDPENSYSGFRACLQLPENIKIATTPLLGLSSQGRRSRNDERALS